MVCTRRRSTNTRTILILGGSGESANFSLTRLGLVLHDAGAFSIPEHACEYRSLKPVPMISGSSQHCSTSPLGRRASKRKSISIAVLPLRVNVLKRVVDYEFSMPTIRDRQRLHRHEWIQGTCPKANSAQSTARSE